MISVLPKENIGQGVWMERQRREYDLYMGSPKLSPRETLGLLIDMLRDEVGEQNAQESKVDRA